MQRKTLSAQQLLEGVKLNYVDLRGHRHFQITTDMLNNFIDIESNCENPEKQVTDAEYTSVLQRMVRCTKMFDHLSDEDLKTAYDLKFGKGDGL